MPCPSSAVDIGVHRAIELEELRVLLERRRKGRVALRFALAAQDFRFLLRLGDRLDDLAVGLGADALRRLAAAGAQPFGFGEALGLHAIEGLLRNLRREVGAADAHVGDLDAERVGVRPQLVAHFAHHLGAILRQRRFEAAQAVDAAQRRVEAGAQPLFGQRHLPRNRCAEQARIGDLVDEEGVDLVELAARDLHADVVEIEAQQPVFDDLHGIGIEERERHLEIDAGLGLDVDDLAEAQHDRLLALVDHEDRRIEQEQRDRRR